MNVWIVAVLAVWQPDGTSDQRWLNEQAREPLEHNADMLKPRLPYRELAAKLKNSRVISRKTVLLYR
jgi:hypothetical protein